MIRSGILVLGTLVATSSLIGCVSYDPSADASEEPVAESAEALVSTTLLPLPYGGEKMYAGRCSGDGFIVYSGGVYRLGNYIGPDVTGITASSRQSYGQAVCHNVNTWAPLVQYVCNANTAAGNTVDGYAGNFTSHVDGPTEWINFVQTQYPSIDPTAGLNFAYSVHPGRTDPSVFPNGDPCPKSAPADLPLYRIECCAAPATP